MSDGHAYPVSPARRSVKRVTRPTPTTRKSTAQYRGGDLTPKAASLGVDETVNSLETLDMAASFLQHCAFCERQIMHPSNNMLYCSQACRRKDTNKPMSFPDTSAMSPPTTVPSSPRVILAASIPTGALFMDYPSIRIPTDHHNATSDLDPTEWKPKGNRDPRSSEAFRYLSQFHTTTLDDNEKIDSIRLYMRHSQTSMTGTVTIPSLASTPTTATSSLSMEYDFNTRALPPRHNPIYSASAGMTKDIGLVTPHIVPGVVGSIPSDANWEKKPVLKRVGGEKNGLLSKSMAK